MPNSPSKTRYPKHTSYIKPTPVSSIPVLSQPNRQYPFNLDDKVELSPEGERRVKMGKDKPLIKFYAIITNLPGHFEGLPNHYEVTFSNGAVRVWSASWLKIVSKASSTR